MPYTNIWDDNVPLGSVPANTIDEQFRKLKLDIHERMTGSVVVDWTTDPVVLISTIGSGVQGVSYDDSLAAGSKAEDYTSIVVVLALRFVGTAINKNVIINLNEINTFNAAQVPPVVTDWQVLNLYLPTLPNGINVPLSFVGRVQGDEALVLRRTIVDVGANTIQLILDSVGGMSDSPRAVDFMIQLPFKVLP